MSTIRCFLGGFTILALASGMPGCGGHGPAAGMPADIPQGVAPVMKVEPIKPGQLKKTGPRVPSPGTP